ncbi:MFS transporter [Agathobaculum sp. TL06]
MNSNNAQSKLFTKPHVGYMFGGAAQTTIVFLISVTLTYYYTNVLGLSIGKVSLIMLLSRFLDGGSDIIAGAVIDRTKSKFGKARPWILRMCIPHLIALIAMYTVPPTSENFQLIYIFVAYNFANTFVNTFAGLAISSLNSLMTRDIVERGQLNAMRQIGAPVMELAISALTIPAANFLGGDQKSWIIVVTVISLIATLCYFLCFLWTKETAPEERNATTEPISAKVTAKAVLGNKFWWIALLLWVARTFINSIMGTMGPYFTQYVYGNVNLNSLLITVEKGITIAIAFLVVPALVKRTSKRNIAILSSIFYMIGQLIFMTNTGNLSMAVVAAVGRGFGHAFGSGVVFAIIADTVEYSHWKFGVRLEGAIFCAATVGQKCGQGVAQALTGGLMEMAGFDGMAAVQSAATMSMITNLYVWTPIICGAVELILMLFYRLEKDLPRIQNEIAMRTQNSDLKQ